LEKLKGEKMKEIGFLIFVLIIIGIFSFGLKKYTEENKI